VILKKAVTNFIVCNLVSAKDLREIEDLFLEYDVDKNGTLDKSELTELLKSQMDEP
jgi:Ca2+-binding EF-hand superfamily protein